MRPAWSSLSGFATERKLVVEALITAVEGLVVHRASKREARRMMGFLAKRLIADL